MKLVEKIKLTTTLELKSGLHIGDSKERSEIGGLDNPVIRRKDNQQPYIPGSSLKGKIRSLLEQINGATKVGDNEVINKVFGIANNDETNASRLIFRDSYLNDVSATSLLNSEFTDMPYTESKWENSIDRVLGKATNPRSQERIPAGAIFNVEIVVNVWEDDAKGKKAIDLLKQGIHALNNDYLGGSGSRGYGHVFIDVENLREETIKL